MSDHLTSARRTLSLEIAGLKALEASLDGPFSDVIDRLATTTGRVILTGMGKSGHVARKIAATLASTGTPAQFVHPGEAAHGDLGMVTDADIVIALSWSGEAPELHALINYCRRFSITLIGITSGATSALAMASDVRLILPQSEEACPNGLAPTTSTTMQLALGDAIAMALLEHRGFTAKDYKVFHPGGQLGAILRSLGDIMHKGDELPVVPAEMALSEALLIMTQKSLGCLCITDAGDALIGIVTDGDLRRHMSEKLLSAKVGDIMSAGPTSAPPAMLASEALNLLNTAKRTCLPVVENGKLVGLVHLHDLLRIGTA